MFLIAWAVSFGLDCLGLRVRTNKYSGVIFVYVYVICNMLIIEWCKLIVIFIIFCAGYKRLIVTKGGEDTHVKPRSAASAFDDVADKSRGTTALHQRKAMDGCPPQEAGLCISTSGFLSHELTPHSCCPLFRFETKRNWSRSAFLSFFLSFHG